MGKERFIEPAVRTFKSAKELVKNKPFVVVSTACTAGGAGGVGWGLAGGLGIDHPAVILSAVATSLNAIATGLIIRRHRYERTTTQPY